MHIYSGQTNTNLSNLKAELPANIWQYVSLQDQTHYSS